MLKRIYLVRHGRSLANDEIKVYREVADHAVPLSKKGTEQAHEAGKFLNSHFKRVFHNLANKPKIRLWSSPYLRTRQTAEALMEECKPWIHSYKEHINLCEQQFGLFDGIPDIELPYRYPDEHEHYRRCEEHGGRFWARMPMGESRFDVAVRIHQAFGTFHRDCDKHNVDHIIVVGHGVTIRAFVMQWLHLSPEWFDAEKNPKNCSVRLIEENVDKGYIHPGQ